MDNHAQSHDTLVSMFANATSPEARCCKLSAVLDAIKNGTYAKSIAKLREIRKTDPDTYNLKKKLLPAFTVSGTAKNRKEPLVHSGLIQGDIDHLNGHNDIVLEYLKNDPHVAFVFVSPSGDGIKFGIVIDPKDHLAGFIAAQEYFRSTYKLEIDPSVKDRLRLCFVSHDPDLWIRPDANPVPPVKQKPVAPPPARSTPLSGSRQRIAEQVLGPVTWDSADYGFCACPGAHLHTTPTNPKDCDVRLPGATTIHCFHGSCQNIVDGVNWKLRSLIGKAEFVPTQPPRSITASEYLPSDNDGGGEFEQAKPIAAKPIPKGIPIGDLMLPPENDPSELLRYRFLCKKMSLLFVGSTGKGKSSALLQALALWSIGKHFFGIIPTRPLSSLYIQAENDDGDIADIRDGICTGLDFTEEERAIFFSKVLVFTETTLTGPRFCNEIVRPLLQSHLPDICAIDPALSYLGGDTKEQRDVGVFLRNHLNPLLFDFDCAAIVNHHTNKISAIAEGESRDFAYYGSGSAEWANWARAILALESTRDKGVFQLHVGKRGQKIGWKDDEGNTSYSKHIAHSKNPKVIFWRLADSKEIPNAAGRPKSYTDQKLLDQLEKESLSTSQWTKLAKDELNISRPTFFRAKDELEKSGKILRSKINGKWTLILHNK